MSYFKQLTTSALLLLLTILANPVQGSTKTHYKAAVVEYNPERVAEPTLETALENAYALAKYAVEARWQGADVLVFPEYGITGLTNPNRDYAHTYIQSVPDPQKIPVWNPCLEPDLHKNTKLLQVISCAARFNALVIVANLISEEPCDESIRACRPDRRNIYNTNVIFMKDGSFAARYRKLHLFQEPSLEAAIQPEYVIVDIGFMKFATVICHDLVFMEPAITAIKEYGVKNILFPTAWVDFLPLMTAPQIFSGYAQSFGVNLIAANLYAPDNGCLGSGIFSSSKTLNLTYDLARPGRLLVAEVPIDPEEVTEGDNRCDDDTHDDHSEEYESLSQNFLSFEPRTLSNLPSSKISEEPTHQFFNMPMRLVKIFFLDKLEGHVDLCKSDFCCHLDYEFLNKDEVYALAVHDGTMPAGSNVYGIQVCAVLRCESEEDKETCGRVPYKVSDSTFSLLSLSGSFNTHTVLPSLLGTDLQIISTEHWKFTRALCEDEESGGPLTVAKIELESTPDQQIMAAGIVGRIFDRDGPSQGIGYIPKKK